MGNKHSRYSEKQASLERAYTTKQLHAQDEARDWLQKGIAKQQSKQYGDAILSFHEALSLCQENMLMREEGLCYGMVYRILGEPQKSLDLFHKHLKICRELEDKSTEAKIYTQLGKLYLSIQDYKTSIDCFNQDWQVSIETHDRQGEARALLNIGLVHLVQGNLQIAIEYTLKFLMIAVDNEDMQGQGLAHGHLGEAYFRMGDFSKATHFFNKRLQIAQTMNDKYHEANSLGNLAFCHHSQGEFATALEYHWKHIKCLQSMDPIDLILESRVYEDFGITYVAMQEFKQAIDNFNKALDALMKSSGVKSHDLARIYSHLGTTHYLTGQLESAIEYHTKRVTLAEQLNDMYGLCIAYGNLGFVYLTKADITMAKKMMLKFENILEKLKEFSLKAKAPVSHGINVMEAAEMQNYYRKEYVSVVELERFYNQLFQKIKAFLNNPGNRRVTL